MIYTVCILQCIWEIIILYQKCCRFNYLNKKKIFKDLVFISHNDVCILIFQIKTVIHLLNKPKLQQILILIFQYLGMAECNVLLYIFKNVILLQNCNAGGEIVFVLSFFKFRNIIIATVLVALLWGLAVAFALYSKGKFYNQH